MDDLTTYLPPLENWDKTHFAYGFLLDYTFEGDLSSGATPGAKNRGGMQADPENIHLLNLNPKQIEQSEPFATSVTFTQGGGKFVESRGGIVKDFTISGTTGLQPPSTPHATHLGRRSAKRIDPILAEQRSGGGYSSAARAQESSLTNASGYFEFYRLRRLFRRFMAKRRNGEKVIMHWLDFKGDEFWVVEPMLFKMTRKRVTYDYVIQFRGLDPSASMAVALANPRDKGPYNIATNASDVANVSPVASPSQGHSTNELLSPAITAADVTQLQAAERLKRLNNAGSRFIGAEPFQEPDFEVARLTRVRSRGIPGKNGNRALATGILKIKFQGVLARMSAIQEFLAEGASLRRAVLETPLSMYKQLASSLQGLYDSILDNTPNAFIADVSEWYLEVRVVTDAMIVHNARTYGGNPGDKILKAHEKFASARAQGGARNAFITEDEDSPGSLPVHPLVGVSGFGLLGDLDRMTGVKALRPEDIYSGETIFDLAHRLLGNVHRFMDLVVLNDLTSPYIVDDPDNKPPGTLAWTETILVPTQDTSAQTNSVGAVLGSSTSSVTSELTANSTGLDLVDTSPPTPPGAWTAEQWVGYSVTMLNGAAEGEVRVITTSTEDTLTLHRPWDTNPSSGDAYKITQETFTLRTPSSPETRAFGRDFLAVFNYDTRLPNGIDIMWGPKGDVVSVEGEENYKQGVRVRMATPIGTNKVHPTYGVLHNVGERLEPNKLAMYTFHARQGLLADPRTQSVSNPSVSFDAGVTRFEAKVQPIRVQRPINFRIPLG